MPKATNFFLPAQRHAGFVVVLEKANKSSQKRGLGMKNSTRSKVFICLFVALAVTPCLQGQDLQTSGNSAAEASRNQMLSWYMDMQEKGGNSGAEQHFYTIELVNGTMAGIPAGYAAAGTLLSIAELSSTANSQNGYRSLGSTFEISSVDDLR